MTLAAFTGQLLAFVARLITGAQGHWKGCPPLAEQRIYIANHQSHFDLVLIWAAFPHELRATTRAIAARDYWTTSAFKRWLTTSVFNAIYVSRTRSNPDEDPLEPLAEALAKGDSLVIFPEGTRSSKGRPMPFKSGIYHLAEQFPDVPLIPTWIDNVQRVMPKGEVVPVPILCTVTFGAPIHLRPGESKADFLCRAREAVMEQRPHPESVARMAEAD
ncbi:lysophospholipid acyltransferase family protein [Roseateles sp.]|uniref:lysophospholipid acyltransferase family protein n=1 Tax=Roseateles sp. TaxID=1971397 RepID=UPI002DFD6356|nr:lysophospholipid acyltransferase family protein [Roseateles sp.]